MENNQPEMKYKLGAVSASIWKRTNKTKDGVEFVAYNTVVEKGIRDANGHWKNINSFDVNDLPKAAMAIIRSYFYILQQRNSENAETETETVR